MTQEQLSGLATLDRTHYSKIERGLRCPTIDTVFKIAFALDMKPHELIKILEDAVPFRILKQERGLVSMTSPPFLAFSQVKGY